jgi:putative oxidoreductase
MLTGMKRITPVARVLLGLVFVVFATNYFVPFLPAQPMPPQPALAFAGALMASGLMTMLKVVELAAGLALLANRAVPLALALLAPIIVGIAFFHLVLAPAGTPIALAVVALELVLAWAYRNAYRPMLRLHVEPAGIATIRSQAPELAVARG